MSKFKTVCAVIFDMDGTIIDSEPLFKLIAKKSASELGFSIDDDTYRGWVGLSRESLERAILKSLGKDFPLSEFKDIFAARWISYTETNGISPKPGIRELLGYLNENNIPLAVATSTPTLQAERSLEIAQLKIHFRNIIGGDQVKNGKPAPDIFLKAASKLNTSSNKCLAVEDSAIGIKSAAAAEMITLLVPDTVCPDQKTLELANYVVPSTEIACRVIKAMFESKP